MKGQLLCTCPVLPTTDFSRTAKFYAKVGFTVMADYPDTYLILRRDGAELHFRPAAAHEHDPWSSHFTTYVRILNAVGLDREWSKLGLPTEDIPRLTRFKTRPWGMCEAYLVDPDGNLVTFGSAINDNETA